MSIGQSQQLQPTSTRPVPLYMRKDLIAKRISYRNEGSWVIKDPVGLKYHRLLDEQYFILQSVNGENSLEDILRETRRKFPTVHLTLRQVQSVVTDLFDKGLLASKRTGQAEVVIERARKNRNKKIKQTLTSLLYLRMPGWDPERTLNWLLPKFRWMFHPVVVAGCCTLVIASWILLALRFDDFQRTMPEFQQFFGWPNLMYLWITLAVAKIIHEFGHGLTCKYYGGECHEMGIMFLVFSPCLYCDVTDSWLLRNKWQRMMIGAAGMYIEMIISALALFLWWWTDSGLLHHLCFNVFTVTTVTTVIFNANPLMRFDGYYIFSDWVEIPNLREKASKMLREKFGWYCFGIRPKPDPFVPESGQNWLALYAIAAAIYRWFLIFAIALFLYTFLKPYGLQVVGIALAVFSVGSMIFMMLFSVVRMLQAPRTEPLNYRKIAVSVLVLGLLIAAGLKIPFSLYAEAPFLIEPEGGREVKVTIPGRLVKVHVKPGQRVKQGDLLVELENPELTDRLASLKINEAVFKSRIDTANALDDSAGAELAKQQLTGVKQQIKDFKQRIEKLKLRAPCDGIVVSPPPRPEQPPTATDEPLPRWHGTPLDDHNRDSFLERQTHVLTVAPSERLVAVALVDQSDRNELTPKTDVELKFDHLPLDKFESEVTAISTQDERYAPPALSNKYGGDLPTVTESNREKLISPAYPVTIPLPGDAKIFRAGMRGRARFHLHRRSAGGWAWLYLRKTFQFRL